MPISDLVFGVGLNGDVAGTADLIAATGDADRAGLDLVSLSDHPYIGTRVDAYAAIGFLLGRTTRIAGLVNVTNLPLRPAPMLARTVAGLSAMSGGRIVLGAGAGGLWDRIGDMGVPRRTPAEAVEAFEEGIRLIRDLIGEGPAVTRPGPHYPVAGIDPAPVEPVPVWTGSVGARSLAATGRVADGWIPGHAADWLSDRFRTGRAIVDEAAVAAGRRPQDVRTVFNRPGRIDDRPAPRTRDDDGRWVGGSVGQWVEELTGAVLDHGASGFVLFAPDRGAPDASSIRRWGSEIAPAVRDAVAAAR